MNNGQILFLYDAKLTNPNGDPDEENRPRMDAIQEKNLVTDLRLKRYIRDFALDQGREIYVQKVNDKHVTSEERIKGMTPEEAVENFVDVRLFGATITKKGDNRSYIGPVQFNWGYSLNKVELVEASITSHFSSTSGNKQGSIGKDYRVKYSFLAFSGTISGNRGEKVNLSKNDIEFLDKAMVKSIPLLSTRSKIGQYPRLYLRLEFNDKETMLKDLRTLIKLTKEEEIFDINEVKLEVKDLIDYLKNNRSLINKIHIFQDETLITTYESKDKSLVELLSEFDIKTLN
ncbi:MAG: type I-B CRISPR-associated protein Cas7/Csh2 [Bacillota bacterium]|nr:type I-B CRISPR-associated protein Cas7/Csh2 [Bacillota bacterium]